ncbi:PHP domain-containing protein [Streptomyces gardneri]|uniref:PHP domain-containing protein n=1 Tax=Streptomyces gardneri TaxID=66892 RepID=UPI0035E2D42D
MGDGVPHLHVASGISARFGTSQPSAPAARATKRGIGTLAPTDRDNVTGTVRFAKAAATAGVRPVFGVDLTVAPHQPLPRGGAPTADTGSRRPAHVAEARCA